MYKILRCENGRGAGVEDERVTVQCRKLPAIIVGCAYRHPKALVASFDYIEDVFKVICLRNKKVFILGDFNDDLLDKGNKLRKVLRSNHLTQIVKVPTRTTSSSAILLDLIITNEPAAITSHAVVPQAILDHHLISAVIDYICKPTVQ